MGRAAIAWRTDPRGERAVRFIRRLKLIGDHWGAPFILDPWQESLVRQLFGSVGPDGLRTITDLFLFLPRGQGKTQLMAACSLYLLLGECAGKRGQEVYSAAADRQQAARTYKAIAEMIQQDSHLSGLCEVSDYHKRIIVPSLNNVYQALATDDGGGNRHSLAPAAIVADELHAWRGRSLWDALRTPLLKRKEPLCMVTTTAGHSTTGLCYEFYQYAKKVESGEVRNKSYLPVLYEAGPDDDWTSRKTWRMAMPASFVNMKEVAKQVAIAKEMKSQEIAFKRYNLNLWQQDVSNWLDVAKWDACEGDLGTLDGMECVAAIDLSSTTDVTSLVLLYPDGDRYKVRPYFWMPRDNVRALAQRDNQPYDQWARQGHIETTSGDSIDYDAIRAKVVELGKRYAIRKIAIDPWNATHIATQLREQDGFDVVQVRQGFHSMNAPAKELERLIARGLLVQAGNPLMRAMVSNVAVKTDESDNIRPVKPRASTRVDGVIALVMALFLLMSGSDAPCPYDEQGMAWI